MSDQPVTVRIPLPRVLRPAPIVRPLTPARPDAVLLPPIALGTVVPLAAAAVQSLVGGPGQPAGHLVAAGALGAFLLAAHYVARTALAAASPRTLTLSRSSVPLAGAALAAATLFLLPSGLVHPLSAGVAWFLALLACEVGPHWRRALMSDRKTRVSLLASSEWSAEQAILRLESLPGLEVESVLIPGSRVGAARRRLGRPVARSIDDLGPLRLESRVIVSCPNRDPKVAGYVAQLVALGHSIQSLSAAVRRAEGRVDAAQVNPLTLLMGMRHSHVRDFARRVTATVGAALLLVLLAPLLLVVAAAILIDDGWPVFYRQKRVGYRGRLFEVVKFRTMVKDAEERSGPVFASATDDRITTVGAFLRKYRLDELPQLWNVLKGEMGFVGPRPERPHFFDVLRADVPLFELRTCVRPGITGWAQVRLPYAADSDEAMAKLEYDLYYVTRRSVVFDLAICFDTVGVALTGAGAR